MSHLTKELGRDTECGRYDGRIHRHDHAVCTLCGALLDIPIDITLSEEILQSAAKAAGVVLGFHEVRIYGQCTACQRSNNT